MRAFAFSPYFRLLLTPAPYSYTYIHTRNKRYRHVLPTSDAYFLGTHAMVLVYCRCYLVAS